MHLLPFPVLPPLLFLAPLVVLPASPHLNLRALIFRGTPPAGGHVHNAWSGGGTHESGAVSGPMAWG